MVLPVKLIDDAIDPETCAIARAQLARTGWTRWSLLDRGSYDFVDAPELPVVTGAIARIARETTGRELAVEHVRAVRMLPGDYVFVRHDRVYDDRPVEVVVDLSAAPVTGAEVHYRHRGQVFFVFPSRPGALAVVERGPTVMRNSTYVSKRLGNVEVVRLFVLLR
jgi:hypothetical protein